MVRLLLYLFFVPQSQLPYIDSLPLDYPDRCKVIGEWRRQGEGKQCCDEWWTDKAATRPFLYDQIAQGKTADEAWYLLGRMQGRNNMWGVWPYTDGTWRTCWFDQAIQQKKEE